MTVFECQIPDMHSSLIRDLDELAKRLPDDNKTEMLLDRIVCDIDYIFKYAWDKAKESSIDTKNE